MFMYAFVLVDLIMSNPLVLVYTIVCYGIEPKPCLGLAMAAYETKQKLIYQIR